MQRPSQSRHGAIDTNTKMRRGIKFNYKSIRNGHNTSVIGSTSIIIIITTTTPLVLLVMYLLCTMIVIRIMIIITVVTVVVIDYLIMYGNK